MSKKQYPGEENRIVDNVILPRSRIFTPPLSSLRGFSIINPRVHGVTARNATACLMFPCADHVEAVGEHRMKLPPLSWGSVKSMPYFQRGNHFQRDRITGVSTTPQARQALHLHPFEDLHFNTVENCNFPFLPRALFNRPSLR